MAFLLFDCNAGVIPYVLLRACDVVKIVVFPQLGIPSEGDFYLSACSIPTNSPFYSYADHSCFIHAQRQGASLHFDLDGITQRGFLHYGNAGTFDDAHVHQPVLDIAAPCRASTTPESPTCKSDNVTMFMLLPPFPDETPSRIGRALSGILIYF